MKDFIEQFWYENILETFEEFIRIPNQSPAFDAEWNTNGYTAQAVALLTGWVNAQQVKGLTLSIEQTDERTPIIFIEIEGSTADAPTTLLYGHMDKQPPFTGWREGLAPYEPVIEDGKIYGRGSSDDGYALFAAIACVKALQDAGKEHPRCVIIIEADEESGSTDLELYVDELRDRIGEPELIVCLDSGSGDYKHFWLTNSLRGAVGGTLRVDILNDGVHSGSASGVVPSSFRILRRILSRLEDETTGEILGDHFYVDIPEERVTQTKTAATHLGEKITTLFPFVEGAGAIHADPVELLLNRTWRPQLAVTGADGLPSLEQAGNVLRPHTSVQLSLRLPPTIDAKVAAEQLKALLEKDPPYGASVEFTPNFLFKGWNAPEMPQWLDDTVTQAAKEVFDTPVQHVGEGGSIPFMNMLQQRYPEAHFLVTGAQGPDSYAHGPNESLEIQMFHKVAAAVAYILHGQFQKNA